MKPAVKSVPAKPVPILDKYDDPWKSAWLAGVAKKGVA